MKNNMSGKTVLITLFSVICLFIACIGPEGPCCGRKNVKDKLTLVTVEQVNQNPVKYQDSLITISGLLKNRGESYWQNPQFVLEDSSGNGILIQPWLPLEMPPMQDPSVERPKIMMDYLDKAAKLTGYLRPDTNDFFKGYEFFFEVKEAIESDK